jgi:hypothetical protein
MSFVIYVLKWVILIITSLIVYVEANNIDRNFSNLEEKIVIKKENVYKNL